MNKSEMDLFKILQLLKEEFFVYLNESSLSDIRESNEIMTILSLHILNYGDIKLGDVEYNPNNDVLYNLYSTTTKEDFLLNLNILIKGISTDYCDRDVFSTEYVYKDYLVELPTKNINVENVYNLCWQLYKLDWSKITEHTLMLIMFNLNSDLLNDYSIKNMMNIRSRIIKKLEFEYLENYRKYLDNLILIKDTQNIINFYDEICSYDWQITKDFKNNIYVAIYLYIFIKDIEDRISKYLNMEFGKSTLMKFDFGRFSTTMEYSVSNIYMDIIYSYIKKKYYTNYKIYKDNNLDILKKELSSTPMYLDFEVEFKPLDYKDYLSVVNTNNQNIENVEKGLSSKDLQIQIANKVNAKNKSDMVAKNYVDIDKKFMVYGYMPKSTNDISTMTEDEIYELSFYVSNLYILWNKLLPNFSAEDRDKTYPILYDVDEELKSKIVEKMKLLFFELSIIDFNSNTIAINITKHWTELNNLVDSVYGFTYKTPTKDKMSNILNIL